MLLGIKLPILLKGNLENKSKIDKDDAKKRKVISSTSSIKANQS